MQVCNAVIQHSFLLLVLLGKDATQPFLDKPHSADAEKILDRLIVGYLRVWCKDIDWLSEVLKYLYLQNETIETDGRLEVPVGKFRIFVVLNEEAPTSDTGVREFHPVLSQLYTFL